MKMIKNLNRYYLCNYYKSSKGLIPLVAFIFLMLFFYVGKDFSFTDFSISFIINFVIAGYASLLFYRENDVEEQILYLQSNRSCAYEYSKIVFLFLLCCFYSVLTIVFLCVKYMLFFSTSLPVLCVIFILHIVCGWCGSMMIAFLHPKIYISQKRSSIAAIVVLVLYILIPYLATQYSILEVLDWLVVPIGGLMQILYNNNSFAIGTGCLYILRFGIYGCIYAFLFVRLIRYKRFRI